MRKLVILSLIIFYLPLFQTCSDDNIVNNSFYSPGIFSEEISSDQQLNEDFKLSLEQLTEKKKIAINNYLDTQKDLTLNSYDIVENFFNDFSWGSLPFVSAFLLIVISIILSFTKMAKLMFIICIISMALLLTELAMFYFSGWLEDYSQVKVGYYLIVIILLFAIRESYKDWKETSGNSL